MTLAQQSLFSALSGAAFSPCRRYRYRLWRRWDERPLVNWIMLNPSTANEIDNDPTVARCQRRSIDLGFGGLIVTNLFAFRATDPKSMKAAADPVGPENNDALLGAAREAGLIVCGWGSHGTYSGRSEEVRYLLGHRKLNFLRLTKGGEPQHPLYLPYELRPTAWSL